MITALIVEDESRIRNGLLKHIPWSTCQVDEVRTAEHAEEAFALCKEFHPDIILSDIRMPGMDGVELCRRLRASYPDSQIIFVTGYAEKEYLKAAIDLHVVSYVEKPIQIPEVTRAVAMAVEAVNKARGYDRTFLTELIREGIEDAELKGNGGMVVRNIQEYIATHYSDKDLSVKVLADTVYLTPNYLNNLFKKATGYTVGQYLLDIRMEAAMRLLRDPEYRLYQIAAMVGYEDADYFTKVFKKRLGMTPTEYRRK